MADHTDEQLREAEKITSEEYHLWAEVEGKAVFGLRDILGFYRQTAVRKQAALTEAEKRIAELTALDFDGEQSLTLKALADLRDVLPKPPTDEQISFPSAVAEAAIKEIARLKERVKELETVPFYTKTPPSQREHP